MMVAMEAAVQEPGKGVRTKAAILDEAARLATVEGIEGISIGGLAAVTGMSKSGLYAHFGSKEQLQLATIEAARSSFIREVVAPVLSVVPEGRERLLALCEGFLSYVERRVFPGAASSSLPPPSSAPAPASCTTGSPPTSDSGASCCAKRLGRQTQKTGSGPTRTQTSSRSSSGRSSRERTSSRSCTRTTPQSSARAGRSAGGSNCEFAIQIGDAERHCERHGPRYRFARGGSVSGLSQRTSETDDEQASGVSQPSLPQIAQSASPRGMRPPHLRAVSRSFRQ
jgi:hypothetical protein